MRAQLPKIKSIFFYTHLKASEGFSKENENMKNRNRYDDHFVKTTEDCIVSISSTTALMK